MSAQSQWKRYRRLTAAKQIGLIAIWVFLMWLGLTAVDRTEAGESDGWLLGVYVFVAATALAGVLAKVWRVD